MPDKIEHFLEVDESMIELLLTFQVLFHKQPEVEYLFRGTPLWSETGVLRNKLVSDQIQHSKICSAGFTSLLRTTRSMTLLW